MNCSATLTKSSYSLDNLLSIEQNRSLMAFTQKLKQQSFALHSSFFTTFADIKNIFQFDEFHTLYEKINSEILYYYQTIDKDSDLTPKISRAWLSCALPGAHEQFPITRGTFFSGIYFIKAATNSGALEFTELDKNLKAHFTNNQRIRYQSKNSRLILFNSQMPHHLEENMSGTYRIAIGFNVVI